MPSGEHLSCGSSDVSNYRHILYRHFLPFGATVTNGVWRSGHYRAKHLVKPFRPRYV